MGREFPWDLCADAVDRSRTATGSATRAAAALVERVLARFADHVGAAPRRLRRQVIHDDWNDYNVARSRRRTAAAREVVGVVDFGDMVCVGPVVADLAVACAYAMLGKPDPIGAAAAIVRGFHDALPLDGRRARRPARP